MADYWTDFYKDVLGPVNATNANVAGLLNTDRVGAMPSYSALGDFAIDKPRGERNVALPNGDTIAGSGSASTDFLRGILGVSPLDNSAKTVEGDSVKPGAGFAESGFDIGPLIARAAVIIAGFIFVAAGLAMFKPGVTVVQQAANSLAKNVAIA